MCKGGRNYEKRNRRFKGYAVGKAYVVGMDQPVSFKTFAENSCIEVQRLQKSLQKSKEQIEEIAVRTRERFDAKSAEIIESHLNL